MSSPLVLVVSVAVGYLLGAIPFGLIFGRLLKGVDIRESGSGRTGATNAMRSLGAKGFALTFAADAAKAVAAVLIARALAGGDPLAESLAATAAVVGHNWSAFIGFGGGRGVSSAFGAMLTLFWPGALVGVAVMAVLTALTRYVSLGSIAGTVVGLLAGLVGIASGAAPAELAAFCLPVAVIVIVQHRDNIQRLVAGTERKIGQAAG
jgi:glycerol-3-phosphate acyltransferase PlsY